jgi:holo-[acyl-carrier protein] synthase
MLSVGVDITEVRRIQLSITRYGDRFLSRVFTERELTYCAGRAEKLAARFAAKEAVSKALGVGIQHADGVAWRDIEIVSNANGQPSVQLAGRAAQRAAKLGLNQFALSLSHTNEQAIAMVVAQ